MNDLERAVLRPTPSAAFVREGAALIDRMAREPLSAAAHLARPAGETPHVRAIFISDLHLGSKGCRASDLVAFLRHYRTDHLYLVGDVFDTWRPMWPNWTDAHDQVLRAMLDMHRAGARLTYLPGNHDALFDRFHGHHFGMLTILPQAIHTTRDGQRLLVTHGDCCDVFADRVPWLAQVGASLESGMRILHHWVNDGLARVGRPRWNGIENVLRIVNQTMRRHDRFEERLAALARSHGVDGIVCGHFHQPALHRDYGVTYANCGDWVEDQTAIVETAEGSLRLVDWARDGEGTCVSSPQAEPKKALALAN